MLSYDAEIQTIVGPAGSLPVLGDDEISQKLLMLIEGTGSVSCNSVFVLYLCRFLNQEELMKRETMVQNP